MRTYDDSFSGQRIYPGKVRSLAHFQRPRWKQRDAAGRAGTWRLSMTTAATGPSRTRECHQFAQTCPIANLSSNYRASSSFAVTARSSVSRMESPSLSSSSARTPAASPGPSSSADSTARVFLRYDPPPPSPPRGRHAPIPWAPRPEGHETITTCSC